MAILARVRGDGPGAAGTAFDSGEAFADLSKRRKVSISGAEAVRWLNELVTADIADIAPGRARRALLLSPDGGVRADFTVAVPGGTLVLLQDPAQRSVLDALAPYVEGDVELEDRTEKLALFGFPGRSPPDTPGTALSIPSCLGTGVDLVAMARERDTLLKSLGSVLRRATDEELEAWRVASGLPRMGVDVLEGDRPADAGLLDAIDGDKAAFVGREALLAEHPSPGRHLVVPLSAHGALAVGDPIGCNGEEVGEITSAANLDGTTFAIARIRADAGGEALVGPGDIALLPKSGAGSERRA